MNEKNKNAFRERKKWGFKWFSLDSLMGKVLCILLVIILTVGAFLAPKLINNIYDANSLMQITYVDMELAPYAVAYANFEEKMKAIARANTMGDSFRVLPAEEGSSQISDADLIAAVNREMDLARAGMDVLFYEGWWRTLTEENLVSREKNTLYMQPQGDRAVDAAYQEAAPIQFWTLSFEVSESQMREAAGLETLVTEGLSEDEIAAMEREMLEAAKNIYTTDRLIVCMDTDFYKIYAVAVAGDERRISYRYGEVAGWALPDLFRVVSESGVRYGAYAKAKSPFADYSDAQAFVTDEIVEGFVLEYWGLMPEDKNIYLDILGELSGCVAYHADEADAQTGEEDVQRAENAGAEGENTQKAGELFEDTSLAIVDSGKAVTQEFAERDVYYEDRNDTDILLKVGCQGIYDDRDGNNLWIQKMGCRQFFDWMEF